MAEYHPVAVLPISTGPDAAGATYPARLALVARRVEPWGHFTVASIAGARRPHDYRLPLHVDTFPADAVELPAELVTAYWTDAPGWQTALVPFAITAKTRAARRYGTDRSR